MSNPELQKHYDATIDALATLIPEQGSSPAKLAGVMQAMITAAVQIGAKCQHLNEQQASEVCRSAWKFTWDELNRVGMHRST